MTNTQNNEKQSEKPKLIKHSWLWRKYADGLRFILRPALAPLLAELVHAINDLNARKVEKDDVNKS